VASRHTRPSARHGQRSPNDSYQIRAINPWDQTSKRLVVSTAGRFPTLAVSIHEVGAFYIILLIAADIRDAAKRDRIPVRGPEDVAARVVTGISGWYSQESLIRSVALAEVIAFGNRTIDFIMAARSLW
jgi:hypothetical protein